MNDINYTITKEIKNTTNLCNELKHNIQTIRDCTDHKIKILGNMLSITKLELNELTLKNEVIDLQNLCNIQVNMLSKIVKPNVETKLTCPKLHIYLDNKHLSQVLTNLCNASKIVEQKYRIKCYRIK